MALNQEQEAFLRSISKSCVHGRNILAKANRDGIEVFYEAYVAFYEAMALSLDEKIEAFIHYKQFVHAQNQARGTERFSPQSKFEPTILEEFLYHLFKEFESGDVIFVGSVKAYNNLYFSPASFKAFHHRNFIKINQKDQDFAIYKKVRLTDDSGEMHALSVPVVSIECKTYLDKTMLEGSIATAEKIKAGNPHSRFYIVTETYEVDHRVDPSTSRIDNIFVLKKGGRASRTAKCSPDVIKRIYATVKGHLEANWGDIEHNITQKGSVF